MSMQCAQGVLLFLVLVVDSAQFQILHSYTLLFYLPILMCFSEPMHLQLHIVWLEVNSTVMTDLLLTGEVWCGYQSPCVLLNTAEDFNASKSDVHEELKQDGASSCKHVINSLSKIDTADSALPKKALSIYQTLVSWEGVVWTWDWGLHDCVW